MRAFRLVQHGDPGTYALSAQPDPAPLDDEAVVRVAACGVNHLDLWLEKGALPMSVTLPRTPGCEISGTIEKVGPHVARWRAGDRVAIQSNLFCAACEFCLRGEESLCLKGRLLGVEVDGGFAEAVTVPARALVALPENVPFVTAAALTLAGSTAMHMLTARVSVTPGDWILVMAGASGVGSAAIQIAVQLGAHVISTGSTPAKRELALKLGAEFCVDSTQRDWPAEVRQITGKRGARIIVEHVGGETLIRALSCLSRGGTVVTCGATTGAEVTLDLWPFFVKEQRLVGSYGRNRTDVERTLEWAGSGKLRATIDSVVPLEQAGEAIARLRARSVLGKIVVQP